MKCPECGSDVQPVDHNGRGPRCPACWARLVVEEAPPVAEPEPAPKPKSKGKAK